MQLLTLCVGGITWHPQAPCFLMAVLCRHITEADLHFFQHRVEEDVVIPGAGKWEHMTDLRLDSLTYTAWRRRLPVSLH